MIKKCFKPLLALGTVMLALSAMAQTNSDCISYRNSSLMLAPHSSGGWSISDGGFRMLMLLPSPSQAKQMQVVAGAYDQLCAIGLNNKRRQVNEYIFRYFEGGTGKIPAMAGEDSQSYEPSKLEIKNVGAFGFAVFSGKARIALLDTQAEAARALAVLKNYDTQIFVGRDPKSGTFSAQYFRSRDILGDVPR